MVYPSGIDKRPFPNLSDGGGTLAAYAKRLLARRSAIGSKNRTKMTDRSHAPVYGDGGDESDRVPGCRRGRRTIWKRVVARCSCIAHHVRSALHLEATYRYFRRMLARNSLNIVRLPSQRVLRYAHQSAIPREPRTAKRWLE